MKSNYSKELEKYKVEKRFVHASDAVEFCMTVLDGFCTADDIDGVRPAEFMRVFDEYCKENKLPYMSERTVAQAVRKKFNVKRRRIRLGTHELKWVYSVDSPVGK